MAQETDPCACGLPRSQFVLCDAEHRAAINARDTAREEALRPYTADVAQLSFYYQRLWARGRATPLPPHLERRVRPRSTSQTYQSVDQSIEAITNAIGRYYVAMSHPYVELLDKGRTRREVAADSESAAISISSIESQLEAGTLFTQQGDLASALSRLDSRVTAAVEGLTPESAINAGRLTFGGVQFATAGLSAGLAATLFASLTLSVLPTFGGFTIGSVVIGKLTRLPCVRALRTGARHGSIAVSAVLGVDPKAHLIVAVIGPLDEQRSGARNQRPLIVVGAVECLVVFDLQRLRPVVDVDQRLADTARDPRNSRSDARVLSESSKVFGAYPVLARIAVAGE